METQKPSKKEYKQRDIIVRYIQGIPSEQLKCRTIDEPDHTSYTGRLSAEFTFNIHDNLTTKLKYGSVENVYGNYNTIGRLEIYLEARLISQFHSEGDLAKKIYQKYLAYQGKIKALAEKKEKKRIIRLKQNDVGRIEKVLSKLNKEHAGK